jgi:hypothetical protein
MCCQAQSPQCQQCRQIAADERAQWMQQCGAPSGPGPGPAPIDCSNEPQRACCRANTPACNRCQQQAAAERNEWAQQCAGPAPGTPSGPPPSGYCSAEPKKVCCAGATPMCQTCRRDAANELRAWQRVCRQDRVDCSRRPSQVCCRANTPACNSCQQNAQADLDRWQAACRR